MCIMFKWLGLKCSGMKSEVKSENFDSVTWMRKKLSKAHRTKSINLSFSMWPNIVITLNVTAWVHYQQSCSIFTALFTRTFLTFLRKKQILRVIKSFVRNVLKLQRTCRTSCLPQMKILKKQTFVYLPEQKLSEKVLDIIFFLII